MSELQIVRKKIQGDFFLEKSYKKGKLFYEVLRYKDDYIGINYAYLEDELREETYINDNRIGMVIVNEKDKIYICTLDEKRREVGITVTYHNKSGKLAHEIDYLDDICMATNRVYKDGFIKNVPLIKDLEKILYIFLKIFHSHQMLLLFLLYYFHIHAIFLLFYYLNNFLSI